MTTKIDEFLTSRGWTPDELRVMSPLMKQQLFYQQVPRRMAVTDSDGYRKIVSTIDSRKQLSLDEIVDGVYQCNCGSRKTTYIQRQTRRADEGMTTIIRCHKCGARWRD